MRSPHSAGALARRSAAQLLTALSFLFWSGAGGGVLSQDVDLDLFKAVRARSLGPAGMSGRITAIAAVESNPDVVYVGAATGGLWKSVNGGQTWEPVFDDQEALGIGSIAVFQEIPEILWVGTGEGNPRNSAGVGMGVYRSVDGGRSWRRVGLQRSERIHRIVLHPSDSRIAYVGVMGPAWSDGEERGVYRTRDGGETWERVLFVNPRTGAADLVMDPSNPDKLIAALWEFRRWPWFFQSGGEGSGLFVTYDGGDHWRRLTAEDGLPDGLLGRSGLAISRADPATVYALVEATHSVLLRSTDGGWSWETVNDDAGIAPRPFYFAEIHADPANELRLYNLHSRLMMSEDGGRSFEPLSRGVHPDFQAMWIDPGNPDHLWVGTDGGVYVSRDRGRHWRFLENLPVGQFYHVSVDMEIPYRIYGGMQDNGSWVGPSDTWQVGGIPNADWKEVGFGDGFGVLIDPRDSRFGYSMSQAGGLLRFDRITGERKGIRPWAPEGVGLRFNWNAPLALDPFDPGVIYYGSQFVHRSPDRGQSWQIISGDLTSQDPEKQRQEESGGLTRDVTGAENHTTLTVIAPSPVEREVIWTGSDDGRLHITRSGGGDWTEVGQRIDGVPEGSWISDIEPSHHAGGTAYVAIDDHRRGNWRAYLYRTEDYGRRWRRVADEEELQGYVHAVLEDPVTANLLFAGTEFGLFVSFDRGRRWQRWRHGIPAVPVRDMVVHPRDRDLVIATHGRGIYVLDDIQVLRAVAEDPAIMRSPLRLIPPLPAYLRSLTAADGYHFPADAAFRGEARDAGAILTYWVGSSPESDGAPRTAPDPARSAGGAAGAVEDPASPVVVRIYGDSARLLRTFEAPADFGMHRVAWDLREDPPAGLDSLDGERGPPPLEVLPGVYRVEMEWRGVRDEASLEVRPDPRREIPYSERLERHQAVRRGTDAYAAYLAVRARLRLMSGALTRIEEELGLRGDPAAFQLRLQADSARAGIARVESALQALGDARSVVLGLGDSRDAPTEAEGIALDRFEEGVDGAIGLANAMVAQVVPGLRRAVESAGIEVLPDLPPLPPRPRRPEREE